MSKGDLEVVSRSLEVGEGSWFSFSAGEGLGEGLSERDLGTGESVLLLVWHLLSSN